MCIRDRQQGALAGRKGKRRLQHGAQVHGGRALGGIGRQLCLAAQALVEVTEPDAVLFTDNAFYISLFSAYQPGLEFRKDVYKRQFLLRLHAAAGQFLHAVAVPAGRDGNAGKRCPPCLLYTSRCV